MKINSLDTENISNATIYKLSQTYIFPNNDPILQKGFYTENFLKSILKESFEFAIKCTNFKDFITEVSLSEARKTRQIETPEDSLAIETPEDNIVIETPEQDLNIETPEDSLAIETPEDEIKIETPEDKLAVENKEIKSKNKKNK
jgi:hypothetical protein